MSKNESEELLAHFERLLAELCPVTQVRALEAGAPAAELWRSFHESGFLDAMLSETQGGAGLTLAEVCPLLEALGRHLVPVPFAQTLIARALLSSAGISYPEGSIVLISPTRLASGYFQGAVAQAAVANFALVEMGDRTILTPVNGAKLTSIGVRGSLAADVAWRLSPSELATMPTPKGGLRAIGAVLRAAEMAGAAGAVLSMTIAYAGNRVQFGKPIARQQAIQQQLAVMAEQTVMARIAAQLGCAHGLPPPVNLAAIAKQVNSAAAVVIAAISHAVHGAIGISEEYDLQLYVRRLQEWRLADGTETYWAEHLGRSRLNSHASSSIEFLRTELGCI